MKHSLYITFPITVLTIAIACGCTPYQRIPDTGIYRSKVTLAQFPGARFDAETEFSNRRPIRHTVYYANGNTMTESILTDTTTETWVIREFYETGAQQSLFHMRHSEYVIIQRWYPNGLKELEFVRTDGKKDTGVRYYLNGKKKEEFEFVNEQRHGQWLEWDSLGAMTRNEFYQFGKLKKKLL